MIQNLYVWYKKNLNYRNLHCFANEDNIVEEDIDLSITPESNWHGYKLSPSPVRHLQRNAQKEDEEEEEEEEEKEEEEEEEEDWVVYSSRRVPVECRQSKQSSITDTDDIDTLTMLHGSSLTYFLLLSLQILVKKCNNVLLIINIFL